MEEIKNVLITGNDNDLFSKKPIEIPLNKNTRGIGLPPGWIYKEFSSKDLLDVPARKTGSVIMNDADSFISYVNRHIDKDFTSIYCDTNYSTSLLSITAIINDHGGLHSEQQWRDHTVIYKPKLSEEWNRWSNTDREPKNQIDFAMFLEENLQDIPAVQDYPTGQQLLEMATSFQANQDMRFKSAIRLQSGGVNMNFVQDDDQQTLTQMRMFEKIAIGIPIFWNGDAYQITARLRYRVKDGKLIFWFELIRKDKVFEDATNNMINKLKNEINAPFYFGAA